MKPNEQREALIKAAARLEALRRSHETAEKDLRDRAAQQLDTMDDGLNVVEAHVNAGKGGILAHRTHRTMLTERERLTHLVAGGKS